MHVRSTSPKTTSEVTEEAEVPVFNDLSYHVARGRVDFLVDTAHEIFELFKKGKEPSFVFRIRGSEEILYSIDRSAIPKGRGGAGGVAALSFFSASVTSNMGSREQREAEEDAKDESVLTLFRVLVGVIEDPAVDGSFSTPQAFTTAYLAEQNKINKKSYDRTEEAVKRRAERNEGKKEQIGRKENIPKVY